MRIIFRGESIDQAPANVARVRLTEEEKGTERLVREEDSTWLEIGYGKAAEMNRRKLVTLCRAIVRTAMKHKLKAIAVQFDASPALFANLAALSGADVSSIAAQNFVIAGYEFTSFKTPPAGGFDTVDEIQVYGATDDEIREAAERGTAIGEAVNAARELANHPGGSMTPRGLSDAAKKAVESLPVTVTTYGREEIASMGMGLLAGVGAGSMNEPTFTVMEYKGSDAAPIVLAGKGITFDSGGLNLKPSEHIYEMHMDMSGAASVIHAVALAARLKLPQHVIGLIPAAENMPGNNATRPGDIQTSLSGKTVEVSDTDAEGRLVLADALTYAKRFGPAIVIDVATLTGASMSALGLHASALLTRDDALAQTLEGLAERSGDYVWRLPLWDEYEKPVKGEFSDLVNYPTSPESRYGGATLGGMFLWQFAKELGCPWAHIDMAPRMTAVEGDELAKGATGEPVRLLFAFLDSWKA